MLLLGVKEEYQVKVKKLFEERGLCARLWYECRGDEDVVIVPEGFATEGGVLLEVEVCEEE